MLDACGAIVACIASGKGGLSVFGMNCFHERKASKVLNIERQKFIQLVHFHHGDKARIMYLCASHGVSFDDVPPSLKRFVGVGQNGEELFQLPSVSIGGLNGQIQPIYIRWPGADVLEFRNVLRGKDQPEPLAIE